MYKTNAQCIRKGHQTHILLIDNDLGGLRPLLEALRSAGHRVSLVLDGEQGYNRAVSSLPDLIVMEVHVPRLDGYALCRWLKASPATAHIPVIFLSAASKTRDKLTGLRCGAVDYVTKPYAVEELVTRVQIHLHLAGARPGGPVRPPESGVHTGLAKSPSNSAALAHGFASARAGADEVLVCAARRELQVNLSTTPSLAEIARRLGVNERRLSRAFHRCLGMTPFDYLREERMRAARRLLRETSLSIAVIATELGYSSAANFSTAFRTHAGQSPSVYRLPPKDVDVLASEPKDFA